jgi:glutaminyl-tRNA synthetase
LVRLKGAYIVKCIGADTDKNGAVTVHAEFIEGTKSGADNSGIKVKGVIHWVGADEARDVTVRLYEPLLAEDGGINPDSVKTVRAKAEPEAAKTANAPVQFIRSGYFRADPDSTAAHIVFNRIVTLKDSFRP